MMCATATLPDSPTVLSASRSTVTVLETTPSCEIGERIAVSALTNRRLSHFGPHSDSLAFGYPASASASKSAVSAAHHDGRGRLRWFSCLLHRNIPTYILTFMQRNTRLNLDAAVQQTRRKL